MVGSAFFGSGVGAMMLIVRMPDPSVTP